MRRLFKPCRCCQAMMEYLDGAWRCASCGYAGAKKCRDGVGIRWGRGFEDRDWLHTSGMRDYLDHRESKQGNVRIRVRERG